MCTSFNSFIYRKQFYTELNWIENNGKMLCRQLRVVLQHHPILHHRCHSPWFWIAAQSLRGCAPPPFWQLISSTKGTHPSACSFFILYLALALMVGPYAVVHHHSILHHWHYPSWLGIGSLIPPEVIQKKEKNLKIGGSLDGRPFGRSK